eukprot:scaffold101799_cov21-Tisochrysis_lutea.AAC.2
MKAKIQKEFKTDCGPSQEQMRGHCPTTYSAYDVMAVAEGRLDQLLGQRSIQQGTVLLPTVLVAIGSPLYNWRKWNPIQS